MEAIGQLTGGIAHDFNNLLTGIIGSLDLVRRRMATGNTEDIHRWMDAASVSAHRAATLTHRLLAFGRRQPLDTRPNDVNRIIASMQDLLQRTMGERIELLCKVSDDLWTAFTDANQLESALLNLAINARLWRQRHIDVELRRKLFGKPVRQKTRPAVGFDQQQLRSHNWNDPTLLDKTQKVVPSVVVQRRRPASRELV
jgi:signal transduction histidine kinase